MAAAIVAMASGLAVWGGLLDPRLDRVTHFAPLGLLAMILVGALIVATRSKGRVEIALVAVGALAWGGLIMPDIFGAAFAPKSASREETLKVVQFNLWAVDKLSSRKIAWLKAQDADVMMFEEAGPHAVPIFAAFGASHPYKLTCENYPHPCPVTMLSKRAPVAGGKLNDPNMAWGRFSGPGGDYVLAATHISRVLSREAQLASLAVKVQSLGPDQMILAGDFNTPSWSFALGRFDAHSGLIRRTHLMPTWPTTAFRFKGLFTPVALFPIDHIYAGREWKTVSIKRGPNLGSDHYPVVAVFTRP